jgi:hypothetical protein
MSALLAYIGAAIVALWGVAHVMPTRRIVESFGTISTDSRRILTMEWIAEGVTHISIGVLAAAATAVLGSGDAGAHLVYRALAVVLIVLAGLTALTGARTPVLWFKVCPFLLTGVAGLLLAASWL